MRHAPREGSSSLRLGWQNPRPDTNVVRAHASAGTGNSGGLRVVDRCHFGRERMAWLILRCGNQSSRPPGGSAFRIKTEPTGVGASATSSRLKILNSLESERRKTAIHFSHKAWTDLAASGVAGASAR